MKTISVLVPIFGLVCASLTLHAHGETFIVNSSDSLRAALTAAQANGDSDFLLLENGIYSTEGKGPFLFDSPEGLSLTLIGNEATPSEVVIQAEGASEALVLRNAIAGGTFTLKGLTLVSGGQGLRTENADTRIEFCAFNAPALPASGGEDGVAPIGGDEMTILSSVFKRRPHVAHDDDDGGDRLDDGLEAVLNDAGRWLLVGTAFTIRNMEVFDRFNAVWAYQDGQWRAYSAKPEIKARIAALEVAELKRIPAYSGFWVWRN